MTGPHRFRFNDFMKLLYLYDRQWWWKMLVHFQNTPKHFLCMCKYIINEIRPKAKLRTRQWKHNCNIIFWLFTHAAQAYTHTSLNFHLASIFTHLKRSASLKKKKTFREAICVYVNSIPLMQQPKKGLNTEVTTGRKRAAKKACD